MCVKNNMRHDDRYSMVNRRSAHVMAQHGILKILKEKANAVVDLIGIVCFNDLRQAKVKRLSNFQQFNDTKNSNIVRE
jgi:hypothetical protein